MPLLDWVKLVEVKNPSVEEAIAANSDITMTVLADEVTTTRAFGESSNTLYAGGGAGGGGAARTDGAANTGGGGGASGSGVCIVRWGILILDKKEKSYDCTLGICFNL